MSKSFLDVVKGLRTIRRETDLLFYQLIVTVSAVTDVDDR